LANTGSSPNPLAASTNYGGQNNPTKSLNIGGSFGSGDAYLSYAIETANKVADYQWDSTNSGYYSIMNRAWTTINDSSKQIPFKYWPLAWFWLYDRTGNATYLDYAEDYMNTLVNKAWANGFYDTYTSTWSPSTSAKSSAGNGIALWELTTAYTRTGDETYYTYAVKTANWIIDNLWDSTNGCFWEDTTLIGTQTYVEGCADVVIGLMSLYQLNKNGTYMSYVSKSINFIVSSWDSVYGGFYARVGSTGSCATVTNGCNKYANENTWPIIALSYYYNITGSTNARSYADRGIDYIDSTLWDWSGAYNGGLFRSLYQNNTIRDNTKTAWDNCGEPWMIWVASENVGGNSTYQTLARRILGYCVSYLHDSIYGGFVTEVNRSGTAITYGTKDAESISDSIASLSLVTPSSAPSTGIPYLGLSVTLANEVHRYMLDTATGAYYYSVSSNWLEVTTSQFSTLGNAFIVDGLLQLYEATGNSTYLQWASHTAQLFWVHGWDPVNGGFYDDYYTNWAKTTCTQSLQNNAIFLIEFLNLYAINGSSVWAQRANLVTDLINERFWDSAAGASEVSYDVCTGTLSGDVQIEESVGSYLWAISQWTQTTGNTTFVARMESDASFAISYLWDGPSNTLAGGPGSVGCTSGGYLGFMRSVYANLSGLEDCRKGANENAWGALGLAYLYSVTGNPVYESYSEQTLTWINGTLWDPTYGGFHQNAYRDNVLRSACSSTNEADDYPGWTEGEQPWLWWSIGQLLGVQTYDNWALTSEQWTAAHQWNSTANNGGDVTCLNGNTLPDLGGDNAWIYDWIEGSALHTYSLPTGLRTEPVELSALLTLYASRPDLQAAFPEVSRGTYSNLVNWAYGVVTQQWTDSGYNALAPYAYWFALMYTYNQRPDLQKGFPNAYVSAVSYQALVSWAKGVSTQEWSDSSYGSLQPFAYWYTLLGTYSSRPDLQSAFPNAYYSHDGYLSLVNWAGGVVTQQWTDGSYATLSPYGFYYALASTYDTRADLQAAFPNAYSSWSGYTSLVNWAGGVVTKQWTDGSYGALNNYGYWYDLMMTYNQRPDLQAAFPGAYTSQASFQNLLNWAHGVVTKQWADSSYDNLVIYASFY